MNDSQALLLFSIAIDFLHAVASDKPLNNCFSRGLTTAFRLIWEFDKLHYCSSIWVEMFGAISDNYIYMSLHSPKLHSICLVPLDLSAIMLNRPLLQGKIGPFVLEVVII